MLKLMIVSTLLATGFVAILEKGDGGYDPDKVTREWFLDLRERIETHKDDAGLKQEFGSVARAVDVQQFAHSSLVARGVIGIGGQLGPGSMYAIEVIGDNETIVWSGTQCQPQSGIEDSPNCCYLNWVDYECYPREEPFSACRLRVEYIRDGARYVVTYVLFACYEKSPPIGQWDVTTGHLSICYDLKFTVYCGPI